MLNRQGSLRRQYFVAVHPVGTKVEIRNRFDGRWTKGFVVEAADPEEGYRVRRVSDNSVLPVAFAPDEVRERKRDMWWV